MSPQTLRVGLLGLGLASISTVPAMVRHPHVQIVAAADSNPDVLERFQTDFGVPGYPSIEALCESPDVDAVYIATPTDLHTRHVVIAASHRKHILVEKPLAIRLEDADGMIAAVERNGVQMVVGHSQSFEPPIRRMRELVREGTLGPVRMISSWYFTDWIYRPRRAEELKTTLGGGVVYRQGAHHFDILRLLAGGLARSVRATTGTWDPLRLTEGSYSAFIEFEDGACATAVYSGYDRFHTTEITGVNERGEQVSEATNGSAVRTLEEARTAGREFALKQSQGFGGARRESASESRHQAHFGLTVVSCEQGDIRQSADGLIVYGKEHREISLPAGVVGRDLMVQELYDAVFCGTPPLHNGRWAKATLEVSLAVLTSARERREVFLSHQVPVAD